MSNLARAIKAVNEQFDQLLFSRVAAKLSGKSVTVKFENSIDDDLFGYVIKENGSLCLFVDPELDEEQMFRTYLHEVAHCALHSKSISDNQTSPVEVAPQAVEVVRALRAAAAKRRETEARALAESWRKLAGSGSLRDRLLKLLGTP